MNAGLLRAAMSNIAWALGAWPRNDSFPRPSREVDVEGMKFARILVVVDAAPVTHDYYLFVVAQDEAGDWYGLALLNRPEAYNDWVKKTEALFREFRADAIVPTRSDLAVVLNLARIGPVLDPFTFKKGEVTVS